MYKEKSLSEKIQLAFKVDSSKKRKKSLCDVLAELYKNHANRYLQIVFKQRIEIHFLKSLKNF